MSLAARPSSDFVMMALNEARLTWRHTGGYTSRASLRKARLGEGEPNLPRRLMVRTAILTTAVVALVQAVGLRPLFAPPWPITEYGGREVACTDSVRAEWRDVMLCVGLDTTPDLTLKLWRVPEGTPPICEGKTPPTGWFGLYHRYSHTIVVRPSPFDREVWRHEFVHARLRETGHPAVFDTHGDPAVSSRHGTWHRGHPRSGAISLPYRANRRTV
jgi:hypothetical protein